MIPLIIVAKDKKKIDQYLKNFIVDNNFTVSLISEILPQKEEISINQVRQLKRDLIIGQIKKRLIIFTDFDRSSIEAQNALLRMLEEANEKNQFLLISNNSEKVLATIRSRSKIIILDKQEPIKSVEKNWLELFQEIKKTTNLSFLNHPKINKTTKEESLSFFHQATIYFREELRKDAAKSAMIIKILKKIFELINLLENNNLNPQLSLDSLLIFIWKKYSMKLNS